MPLGMQGMNGLSPYGSSSMVMGSPRECMFCMQSNLCCLGQRENTQVFVIVYLPLQLTADKPCAGSLSFDAYNVDAFQTHGMHHGVAVSILSFVA